MIKVQIKHPRRLLALADYIETVPQVLFTMTRFRNQGEERKEHCGAVGCVVGHAPKLILGKRWASLKSITVQEDETYTRSEIGSFDWEKVSEVGLGVPQTTALWDYLFDSNWGAWGTDNTPTGAAERIRWVVKHKAIPDNWRGEINGDVPLSYKQGELV